MRDAESWVRARPALTHRAHWWVTAASALVFSALAVAVALRWQPMVTVDRSAVKTMDGWSAAHPGLRSFWVGVSTVLQPLTWQAASAASALWLLARRRIRHAAAVVIAVAGATGTSSVVKAIIDRHRPVPPHVVAHAAGWSFPSGHATAVSAAVTIGVAVLAAARERRHGLLVAARGVGAVLVCLVGLSRIGLAVHFPSDVVAGFALGVFWASVGATVLATAGCRDRGSGHGKDEARAAHG